MAWEARSGLKHVKNSWIASYPDGLNGLGSPFGIETILSLARSTQISTG